MKQLNRHKKGFYYNPECFGVMDDHGNIIELDDNQFDSALHYWALAFM